MYLKDVAVLYVKINYAELISYPADSLSRKYISAEAPWAEQSFPTVGLLLWIYSNEIQSYVRKPLEKQTNWMILQQALFVQSAFVWTEIQCFIL